jgi:hypothetical protein
VKKKKNEVSPISEKFEKMWQLVLDYDIVLKDDIHELDGSIIMLKIALPPERGGFFRLFQNIMFGMAKYNFENQESMLFVFAIPNPKDKSRDLNDLILKIMYLIEDKYSYFDYSRLKVENQYKYLLIVKKIKDKMFI